MEEKTVQAVPVIPFALMYASVNAIIGLIVGIFFAVIFGAAFSAVPSTSTLGFDPGIFSVIFGVGAVIIIPIMAFIGGLIQAIIMAAIYNFLAPRIGGIKLRFKEESPPPPK